jgi:hypothetical protein
VVLNKKKLNVVVKEYNILEVFFKILGDDFEKICNDNFKKV